VALKVGLFGTFRREFTDCSGCNTEGSLHICILRGFWVGKVEVWLFLASSKVAL